jgi:hypothetical protein
VSFRPNAGEFWEVHEVLRKLMLMGALVLIKSTEVRMVVALLVCVVSVMSLNYFRPHKNQVVLMVAQASFLLTSFKYILAIVLDGVTEEGRESLGWVLIVLDVCFVLGSICSLFAVFYLLSANVKGEIEEEHVEKVTGSTTKVVPRNVNEKAYAEDIRGWGRSGGGSGGGETGKEEGVDKISAERRVSRKKSYQHKNPEQALL